MNIVIAPQYPGILDYSVRFEQQRGYRPAADELPSALGLLFGKAIWEAADALEAAGLRIPDGKLYAACCAAYHVEPVRPNGVCADMQCPIALHGALPGLFECGDCMLFTEHTSCSYARKKV